MAAARQKVATDFPEPPLSAGYRTLRRFAVEGMEHKVAILHVGGFALAAINRTPR
jgi:hypothetical protein